MASAYRRLDRALYSAGEKIWLCSHSFLPTRMLARKPLHTGVPIAVANHEDKHVQGTPEQPPSKVVVLGGNGFVGTHVCKEALNRGLAVVSLSRSGSPQKLEPWMKDVTWIRGNLFEPRTWKDELKGVTAVISCVGGFGSYETMRKINGDANILAVNAAADAGVKRFVYISAADFGSIVFFLRGYYEGKRATEVALQEKFPYGGVILRPGMIYGTRVVKGFSIPLTLIGKPLDLVFRNLKPATQIPVVGPLLTPPVDVAWVSRTAVRSAIDNAVPPGVIDVWGIRRLGEA